jgi:hypothetical protein
LRLPDFNRTPSLTFLLLILSAPVLHPTASSAGEDNRSHDQAIVMDGYTFENWSAYVQSDYFRDNGRRCGTPDRETREMLFGSASAPVPSDCSSSSTNPTSDYAPGSRLEIPVVVHVLMDNTCTNGVISDAMVQSQIDILNEDFLALAGSNGAGGTDAQIQFALATEDPDGHATNGITRTCNTLWFNDSGSYWNTLAWDPNRYLNIYTNTASGALGYVPFLPADAGGSLVGELSDRVVILWSAFGRDSSAAPYDQGRTATHEVGHYLGLEHTFNPQGACGDENPPGCYGSGDLICDTLPQASPNFGCPVSADSCGTSDPFHNYMDYTEDLCMEEFTVEQSRRTRCSLEHYRPDLAVVAAEVIFSDGFESGDSSSWTSSIP